jgi:predicted neutral ceramidase superfamily lipid hydrolase
MDPFAVVVFIAATVFLAVALVVVVRSKKKSSLSELLDGYVLLALGVVWLVMLGALVASLF